MMVIEEKDINLESHPHLGNKDAKRVCTLKEFVAVG